MIFKTRNSTYELDEANKKIRRLHGDNPPTDRFSPDGEWKNYAQIFASGGGLLVQWDAGKATQTSPIVDWDDPSNPD